MIGLFLLLLMDICFIFAVDHHVWLIGSIVCLLGLAIVMVKGANRANSKN